MGVEGFIAGRGVLSGSSERSETSSLVRVLMILGLVGSLKEVNSSTEGYAAPRLATAVVAELNEACGGSDILARGCECFVVILPDEGIQKKECDRE